MDLEIAMTPMPHEYRKKRVLVRCYECRNESVTPFHILRLKCLAPDASCGGSYNTVKIGEAPDAEDANADADEDIEASRDLTDLRALMEAMVLTMAGWNARNEEHHEEEDEEEDEEQHEEDEAAP